MPDDVAIVLPDQTWSYGAIDLLVDRIAGKLSSDVSPGQRVVIDITHLGLHWLVTLAVERLGGVSMALPGAATSADALAYSGADRILAERPLAFEADRPVTVIDQVWVDDAQADPRPTPKRYGEPKDGIRVVVTSGTTGINRMILLTREMLDRRICHSILSQVFAKPKPRVVSEVGPSSIGGFMLGLASWMVGGAICQRDPTKSWAETLNDMQIDALVMAPIQLKLLLESLPPDYKAPAGMALFVAGGSLSRPLMEATRARLTDNIVLTYGATETGSVAIGHAGLLEGFEDGAGFIQPWAEVEVLDPEGAPVPPNTVGEIRVRGVEVVDGYADGFEDNNRATFKDGWFYPRDLGFVTPSGVLKVLGRLDDLMHLGGRKILPSRLEEWALSIPGVGDAAAFSLADAMGLQSPWLAFVRREGLDVAALQARMDQSLKMPVRLLEVPAIPRNALGKIVRRDLRDLGAKVLAGQS